MIEPSHAARHLFLGAALTSACAPAIAEQVAQGHRYPACRRARDGETQAEFERAELAARVDALFGGAPRLLADLPWDVEPWRPL